MAGPSEPSRPLLIVGAGEFGQIAYEYFTHDSPYTPVGFAAETGENLGGTLCGLPVCTLDEAERRFPSAHVEAHVAVTYTRLNTVRARLIAEMKARRYRLGNYISSQAFVWHNVEIGENVFIFENNVVQPFCSIGNGVVLWSGNHIGHRTRVGDNVYISSHVVISGYCDIGERCFIGVNAAFADHVTLAEDCFVAMGASVTDSITTPDRIVKGAPARASERLSAKRYMKVR